MYDIKIVYLWSSAQQGEAAIHLAVKYNHLDLLTLFATAKADLNIETKVGSYIVIVNDTMSLITHSLVHH